MQKGPPRGSRRPCLAKPFSVGFTVHLGISRRLDAEGTSAATGALYVRVIELETRALKSLYVVDRDTFEVHFAHLVDEHLQAVELIDIVRRIFLILEGHMVAESRATAAHNGNSQGHRRRILLAHNFFHFCRCYRRNCNHLSIFTPYIWQTLSSISNLFGSGRTVVCGAVSLACLF